MLAKSVNTDICQGSTSLPCSRPGLPARPLGPWQAATGCSGCESRTHLSRKATPCLVPLA